MSPLATSTKRLAKSWSRNYKGKQYQHSSARHSLTLDRSAKMVKCDVVKWDDQLAMFKDALANSPSKRIDVVVANAGISSTDDVFDTDRMSCLNAGRRGGLLD